MRETVGSTPSVRRGVVEAVFTGWYDVRTAAHGPLAARAAIAAFTTKPVVAFIYRLVPGVRTQRSVRTKLELLLYCQDLQRMREVGQKRLRQSRR